jgi:hypothetical protein
VDVLGSDAEKERGSRVVIDDGGGLAGQTLCGRDPKLPLSNVTLLACTLARTTRHDSD